MAHNKTTSEYYKPLESPTRYPLELKRGSGQNDGLHIVLWSEDGRYCWTVAYWVWHKEGPELKFVGDRPLDDRVRWKHFGKCVRQGQKIMDEMWKKRKKADD